MAFLKLGGIELLSESIKLGKNFLTSTCFECLAALAINKRCREEIDFSGTFDEIINM